MFDKITICAKVTGEEIAHLADLHQLHVWTNSNNTAVEYRSGKLSKISGIEVKIYKLKKADNKFTMTMSLSLHKYWERRKYGKLRNDTLFTISEARAAFDDLLFENGLIYEKVRITFFEIGLNLPVSYDPIEFIELVNYIGITEKLMFVDANYNKDRQRTTLKPKQYRKYYKIYDKGWEMAEKRRTPIDDERKPHANILRIETVYRRQNERSDKFFTEDNLNRIVKRFWIDWKDLFFFRQIRAQKGRRNSEKQRAYKLVNSSPESYLSEAKNELKLKKITEKEYRTIREFIRDYNEEDGRFKTIITKHEKEYNRLIISTYKQAKE